MKTFIKRAGVVAVVILVIGVGFAFWRRSLFPPRIVAIEQAIPSNAAPANVTGATTNSYQLSGFTDIASTSWAFRPQWSFDGNWIVYDDHEHGASYKTNSYKIYRMHPDGSGVECLTCDRPEVPLDSGGAQMDPSGRYVIFTAEQAKHYKLRSGTANDPGGGIFNDLAVLDLTTQSITRLHVVGSGLNGEGAGGTLFPRFSYSGNEIAWSDYVGAGVSADRFGAWRIMVADFVPTPSPHIENIRTFTPDPRPDFYEIQGWTPDNKSIILSTAPLSGQDDNALDIAELDVATGELKQLTTTSGVNGQPEAYDEHAAISPLGDALAFMSSLGYGINTKTFFITWLRSELWIANADGSAPRQLSFFNTPGNPGYDGRRVTVSMISWAPDASALVANVYYYPDAENMTGSSYIRVFHFARPAGGKTQ